MNKNYNKNYPFKKTPLIYLMIMAIAIMSILGVIFSAIRIFKMFGIEDYFIILDIIIITLSLVCIAFLITIIADNGYKITDDKLLVGAGIFKRKILFKDIINITLFTKDETLYFYYKTENNDKKSIAVLIEKSKIDDFIRDLKSDNKHISYSIESED